MTWAWAQLISLSYALLAAITWAWLVAGAEALIARQTGGADAARCARALRLMLYAPLWAPAALLMLAHCPGLLAAFLGVADHCISDGASHHHHLCVVHPPDAVHPSWPWVGALMMLCSAALALARGAWRARRALMLGRSLLSLSRPSLYGHDVRLLDEDSPLALTLGWFRPQIVLSRGLIERVSDPTLRVVLAHERAHIARHDTRWGALDQLCAWLLPARPRRALLNASLLARERACDERAARELGSALVVAQALLEVAGQGVEAAPVGESIAQASLEARVNALLQAHDERQVGGPSPDLDVHARRWSLTKWLLAMASLAMPVHWSLERLASWLMH